LLQYNAFNLPGTDAADGAISTRFLDVVVRRILPIQLVADAKFFRHSAHLR
jgi:hypothetical protein